MRLTIEHLRERTKAGKRGRVMVNQGGTGVRQRKKEVKGTS